MKKNKNIKISQKLREEINHGETVLQEQLRFYGHGVPYFLTNFLNSTLTTSLGKLIEKKKPLKILDLGVGHGSSSVFFATHGHNVTSIEPNMSFCLKLEEFRIKHKLSIQVVNTTSEDQGLIKDSNYDMAFFIASLHHCEDPIFALNETSRKLKPGGTIVLIEPILKPFWTKKRFYRKLQEKPIRNGHYGGNEHIYYAKEYHRMLHKSNFKIVESFPLQELCGWRALALDDISATIKNKSQNSPRRVLFKILAYQVIAYFTKFRSIRTLLLNAGLISQILIAKR